MCLFCAHMGLCSCIYLCIVFLYLFVHFYVLVYLYVYACVLNLPSCRAPEASACQFVGPLKSRLTGTDPERIKEM